MTEKSRDVVWPNFRWVLVQSTWTPGLVSGGDRQADTRAESAGRSSPCAPAQRPPPALPRSDDYSSQQRSQGSERLDNWLPSALESALASPDPDFDLDDYSRNDGQLRSMDLVTGAPLPALNGHGSAHHVCDSPEASAPSSTAPAHERKADDMEVAPYSAPIATPATDAPVPAITAQDPPLAAELPISEALLPTGDAPEAAEAAPEGVDEPAQLPPATTSLDQPIMNMNMDLAVDLNAALHASTLNNNDNITTTTTTPNLAHAFVPDMPLPDDMMEPYAVPALPQQRLSAFARLRFSDGSYYMHTYQIVLGRNVEYARRDMRRLAKAEELRKAGDVRRAEALLRGKRKQKGSHRPRSVISSVGGIVNAPMSAMPMDYQQRRQSVASHSMSSSSHRHGESSQEEHVDQAPQHVIMQAFEEVPEHIETYVPEDPSDCPLVPIHPQQLMAMSGVRGPKGISREHAKIYYNFEKGCFEIKVLSSNGLYHEDQLYHKDAVVELNHGDTIVIGMVEMSFFLPDIALTEEQRARQESGSRPMSFSFENGQGEVDSDELIDDDSASEEASVDPRHLFHMPVSHYDSDEDLNGEEEEEEEDNDDDEDEYSTPEPRPHKNIIKQKLKLKLNNKAQKPLPPPSRKEIKTAMKRKPLREPTPDEPITKKHKPKPKPVEKDAVRDKGKTPAKAVPSKSPVKQPTKEPTPIQTEHQPEVAKAPKPESPTLLRKPEARESVDDGLEQEGTITAEMVKRHNLPEALIGMVMEKRKGPGRPPKDGVMSKRQRAQLVKQGKEIEKAKAAGMDPADIPMPTTKPKVARPRKDSNANQGEGDGDDVRETTETADGLGISGDKKTMKLSKPPRTPSPEMRIEDYTEEQLQRPSANYVVLIHEAISSSKTGQMNLQQIYNYIERKYPWYKFKTTTSGWQSSVRHNLGQHDAFVKGDKEGKGFNWKINPDVSIEKERRKRQVSPQLGNAPRQGYYPPASGYPPYAHPGPYYPGMPQVAPNGAPRPPAANVEPVQPRLPPSLARSAAAAPASSAGSNPSPYASPWAAGNSSGSPPNQGVPRPFPPPNNSQTAPGSAGAPSGQYGVLFPTSAPQSNYTGYSAAGPYGSQYSTTGSGPYTNAPNRPYTPYTTSASPANAPHTVYPTPHSHIRTDSRMPHPSGRYPASIDPALIHQLEAFRTVYLDQTKLPRAEEETKVDNVIRAIVYPAQTVNLTTYEQQLKRIITDIETIKQLGVPQAPKNIPTVKQESTPDTKANDVESTEVDSNTEAPKLPAASTAAALAATDAAVAASTIPKPSTSSLSTTQPEPLSTSMLSASEGEPSAIPFNTNATVTKDTHSLKSSPNKGEASTIGKVVGVVSSPILIQNQTSRPSVEPITPIPGSPAILDSTATKHEQPAASDIKDA